MSWDLPQTEDFLILVRLSFIDITIASVLNPEQLLNGALSI